MLVAASSGRARQLLRSIRARRSVLEIWCAPRTSIFLTQGRGGGSASPVPAAPKPALSVAENLSFWRDFLGGDAGDIGHCLKAVGLGHATHLPAAFLSAGQRRRLSIARLLVVRRPVWLLDEPTSALDTAGQELFVGVMGKHLATGGIIIAATHAPLGIETRELRMGARA